MKRALALIATLLFLSVLVRPLAAQTPEPRRVAPAGEGSHDAGKPEILSPAEAYGRLPLSFEANDGQTDRRVKFLSHSGGQTLFLTSTEAVLTPSSGNSVRMNLIGANRHATVSGLDPLPGKSNYFLGRDRASWRTNVSTFGKVRYGQIYPGIDLVYYGNQRQLEYDFVVAPATDPAQIRLSIRGASKLSIDADGNAVAQWKDGDVRLLKPRLYQEVRGEKVEIAGGYALKGNELRFAVGPYDHRQKLVIDPVLVYSTYLGGINSDGATGVAVDSAGNAYVVGVTSFTGFPVTTGVFQPTSHGSTNAFVAKLNAAGTALVYSTYIGGSGQDTAYAIAVDASGNAYITGTTISTDFPTTGGAFQTLLSAAPDAFVTKLSPDGSALVYSTYLGGNANDIAFAIAVDASGHAYVVGETQSGNFPVLGSSPKVLGGPISCDSSSSGGFDGFITKFNPAGDTVAYSLYLGGSGTDVATGVAVDSSGNAYVAGYTSSTDFLVKNTCPGPGPGPTSLQSANAGTENGFVVKVSPDGSTFLGATYLGGTAQDAVTSIALDASGFVYLGGESTSGGAGGVDAFGAKLNGSLSSKVYFNYIGGSGFDGNTGVAVDPAGNEYLVGQTTSTNFPQVSPIQPVFGGGTYDAFVTELDPNGTTLFSTYLGGAGDESTSPGGGHVAADASGNIYVVGSTNSTNFPGASSSSIQPANGGGNDAFIVKLGPSGAASTTALATSGNPSVFGQQVSLSVTVSPNSASSSTPSGAVTINDGSTTLGTVTLVSGAAIFNTSTLAVGTHSITASYAGDANFSASTSTPLSQVVNQGTTTTSISASPNPGIVGQAVTLSAAVSPVAPASGTPTGTVTFSDGATPLGTGTLSGGQATLATSSLTLGTHSITVMYPGDPNFAASTSSAVSLAMQQTTTTTLIVAPNPANVGQLVTLSATVAATSGPPTGETVTFLDGAAVLGTGTISAGGMATLTTALLAVGSHNLSASYPGDANFAPSSSGTVPLIVVLPPVAIMDNETITVTDTESLPDAFDPEAIKVADLVWVTPLINVAAPVISFSAGGLGFSNVAAGQTGTQSLTVSDIGQAPLVISSAAFSPGSAFSISQISCSNGAASLPATLPVGGACVLLISYMAPSGPASSDVLTFTDNAGLSNLPSVQSGSSYTQSVPVSGSGANTAPPPPPPAVVTIPPISENIKVTDLTSFPDVADSEKITVTDQVSIQLSTTTSISVTGGTVYGTPASVVVSVGPSTTVTGNVTLSVDGGTPTAMPLSGGSAAFTLGVLTVGNHSLAANFAAQGNFLGSSAQTKFAVSQATPTITWANPAPITYGTPLGGKQLNATASVPGTLVFNPPTGTLLNAGSQTLSVIFAPTDSTDYTKAAASVTLVVNQATPTITWANPAPITLGTPLSTTQLNATASVAGAALPGAFVYNPPFKTILSAGTQTLSVTFTPTDTKDYQIVTASVSITVNVSGNLSIQPGQTVTFTNGSVAGNVTLSGGTLTLNNSTVGGNLIMSSGSLTLGGNSTISGNVQIQGGSFSIGPSTINGNLQVTNIPAGSTPGVVCDARVSGNLQFQGNGITGEIGPATCSGNTIKGNLQITNNTAPLQIFKNTVSGDLQCSGNSSSLTGGQNTAALKQGQCAKL